MAKLGRNDACHCGSGRKYKKCCLEKDQLLPMKQGIPEMKSNVTHPFAHLLSYEEVNNFSTEEIIAKLAEMGIPFEKETFLSDVEHFYSAEELSENWFRQYHVTVTGGMEDFPWLAACVLWERLAPVENLSMEQMSDLLEQGYDYLEAETKDYVSACDAWLKMWEAMKYRINPRFTTVNYLEKHYQGSFLINNYCQDLELELHRAGRLDPIYFQKRIQFCQEYCDFFPGESELIIHNMRRGIADSYGYLEQFDKAEEKFSQLVADFPDNPWGYIGWGDLLYMDKKEDLMKAMELYKKAMAIAADEGDKSTAEERLADLKQEL